MRTGIDDGGYDSIRYKPKYLTLPAIKKKQWLVERKYIL